MTWSIVGVMRDSRYDRLDEPYQPYFCVPVSQMQYAARLMLLVQTLGIEPAALRPVVTREIQRIDPNLPVGRMLTGDEFLRQPLRDTGGAPAVMWGPGLLALLLAMVGLYGLVAYSVSQRTTEFGVRIALGAQPIEVARLVLRQAIALMLVGCGIGSIAAVGVARLLAGQLYHVRSFEPLVFAVVLPLLVLCGALACCGPAREEAAPMGGGGARRSRRGRSRRRPPGWRRASRRGAARMVHSAYVQGRRDHHHIMALDLVPANPLKRLWTHGQR